MTTLRRVLVVAALVATCLGAALPARGQEVVTAVDADDVGHRLDLRSVTVAPAANDRARITIRFWDRVPAWLIAHHIVRVEMSTDREDPQPSYVQQIFRNRDQRLRLTWGEAGSFCCGGRPAYHPDAFTYTAVLPFSIYGAVPPPMALRGVASRRAVRCDSRDECLFGRFKMADRTPWATF